MENLALNFSTKMLSNEQLKLIIGGLEDLDAGCGKCTDDSDYLCSRGTTGLPGDHDCNCNVEGLSNSCVR